MGGGGSDAMRGLRVLSALTWLFLSAPPLQHHVPPLFFSPPFRLSVLPLLHFPPSRSHCFFMLFQSFPQVTLSSLLVAPIYLCMLISAASFPLSPPLSLLPSLSPSVSLSLPLCADSLCLSLPGKSLFCFLLSAVILLPLSESWTPSSPTVSPPPHLTPRSSCSSSQRWSSGRVGRPAWRLTSCCRDTAGL